MPIRLQGRARCHRARQSGRALEKQEHERLAAGRPSARVSRQPHRIRIAPGRRSATNVAVEHQAPRWGIAPFHLAAVAGNLAAPVADDYLDSCLATCRVARSRISSVRLERRAAASPQTALDWSQVTVHPYTCAAVELRHGPLTMAAAKTWLAAERRAIERIKRQATPMPIVAATRHRSPTRSRRNRTTSRIPSWTARP